MREVLKNHPELRGVLTKVVRPRKKDVELMKTFKSTLLVKDGIDEDTADMLTRGLPGYLTLLVLFDNNDDIQRKAFKLTISPDARKSMHDTQLHRDVIAKTCDITDVLCIITGFEMTDTFERWKNEIHKVINSNDREIYPLYVEWGVDRRFIFIKKKVRRFIRSVCNAYIKSRN